MILPDYLAPGLKVVFCGTAPGRISAQRGHYYANAGNQFWSLLALTGLTPQRVPAQLDHQILTYGLGLTDLAKTAFGQDAEIPVTAWDPNGLFRKMNELRPVVLAFTSLTAARLALGNAKAGAGQLPGDPRLPGIGIWALPSPSGLARRHFSAQPWQALGDWIRSAR